MSKRTNTSNEKALGRTSEGSMKRATNSDDSNAVSPNQLELKLTFKAGQPATKTSKYGLKSTATEAQYERIDRMLTTGEKSTFQFRRAGIMSPASRIKEMNDKLGYYIPTTDQRDIYDEQGFLHKRVAIYELVDRPKHGRGAAI
ncbi:hypothetical protein [Polaromonas sp. CG9_12]|nr:hypothetical protein [Polaromonas sp. CG9_12]